MLLNETTPHGYSSWGPYCGFIPVLSRTREAADRTRTKLVGSRKQAQAASSGTLVDYIPIVVDGYWACRCADTGSLIYHGGKVLVWPFRPVSR